ncbi:MAG: hypothetical protein ACLQLC_01595 [Candidatus Sulfotelmatobacter sp.]
MWETVGMATKKYLMVPCPKCHAKPGEPCKLIGKCIKTAPGAWVSTKVCHDERMALSGEDAGQAAAGIVGEATEGR